MKEKSLKFCLSYTDSLNCKLFPKLKIITMSSYSYDGKVPVIIFRNRGEGGLEDFGGSHGFRMGGGGEKETGRGQSLLT